MIWFGHAPTPDPTPPPSSPIHGAAWSPMDTAFWPCDIFTRVSITEVSQLVFLALIRAGSRHSSRGGGGGGSGLEFFEGGGGGVRVQVRGNFHILTSKTKTTSGGGGGVVNPLPPPPPWIRHCWWYCIGWLVWSCLGLRTWYFTTALDSYTWAPQDKSGPTPFFKVMRKNGSKLQNYKKNQPVMLFFSMGIT